MVESSDDRSGEILRRQWCDGCVATRRHRRTPRRTWSQDWLDVDASSSSSSAIMTVRLRCIHGWSRTSLSDGRSDWSMLRQRRIRSSASVASTTDNVNSKFLKINHYFWLSFNQSSFPQKLQVRSGLQSRTFSICGAFLLTSSVAVYSN